MKCSQCGNEKLVKSSIPMESCGDGWSEISKKEVDIYLCTSCGHYEFFSMKKVHKYEEMTLIIKGKRDEIAKLETEMKDYYSEEKEKSIIKRIADIEEELKNIDITIRQQQKLKDELKNLNQRLKNFPINRDSLRQKISQKWSKLLEIEKQIKNGDF